MESQQIGIDGLSRALYFCREKGRNAVQIMQVQKEDIRSRVLAAARRQFGRKGYSGTSMREIAASAGVGVGNIYKYFTSKDDGEDIMAMRSEKYLESCIDEYVSLIDRHRGLMEILLLRAQGSSLEHFREDYTDRSTEVVKAWFASMQRKHPGINTAVSDFIIHLHTVWMFTMFEELLMHSVPRQEMESILHDYILFEIQGWRAIIRI